MWILVRDIFVVVMDGLSGWGMHRVNYSPQVCVCEVEYPFVHASRVRRGKRLTHKRSQKNTEKPRERTSCEF